MRCAVALFMLASSFPSVAFAAETGATQPATSNKGLWLAEPVALDDDVDDATLSALRDAMADALAASGASVRQGDDALFRAEQRGAPARVERARALLRQGEELYMAFEYSRAAAALAEAAGLFASELAQLEEKDLTQLYRARLLEGLAWLDSGKADAARDAFVKLAIIRPDYDPDEKLMPPHAQTLYEEAVTSVLGRGTGIVELRSEPAGAEVFVDGISRGRTPLTFAGLPSGTHGLKVSLRGYAPVLEEMELLPKGKVQRSVRLTPLPERLALDRVRTGAAEGVSPSVLKQDLDIVADNAGTGSVVLVGVATWQGEVRSAALVRVTARDVRSAAAQLAPLLLKDTWPPAQRPEEARPLNVDFERALLGVGPGFGRDEIASPVEEESGVLLWGGVGAGAAAIVAAGVAAAVIAVVVTQPEERAPPPSDRVELILAF